MPGSAQSSGDAGGRPSGISLFRMLWEALVDLLGCAATAALLQRAARRALARSPELGALAISRVDRQYSYLLPRSFDTPDGQAALRNLLDELRPLLVELTGSVALRRLERVSGLREWAAISP
jgi:hypothetical protein